MDFIFIRELRIDARVGLHKHEKIAPQTIELTSKSNSGRYHD
jgi:dihydroneopterin aldolase